MLRSLRLFLESVPVWGSWHRAPSVPMTTGNTEALSLTVGPPFSAYIPAYSSPCLPDDREVGAVMLNNFWFRKGVQDWNTFVSLQTTLVWIKNRTEAYRLKGLHQIRVLQDTESRELIQNMYIFRFKSFSFTTDLGPNKTLFGPDLNCSLTFGNLKVKSLFEGYKWKIKARVLGKEQKFYSKH